MQHAHSLASLLLVMAPAWVCAQDKPLSTAHDGRWTAAIVCEDFRSDKGTLAKGYTVQVALTIEGGRIDGTRERGYATSGELRYVGEVHADGELLVRAVGATGKAEYTPNRVAAGTNFAYTLKGRLDADRGTAQRVELRPCTASFTRLN